MPRSSRQIQGRWRLCGVLEMDGEHFRQENTAPSCGAGRSNQRWRPFKTPSQRSSNGCPTTRLVVWGQILDGISVDRRSGSSSPFPVATARVFRGRGLFGAAFQSKRDRCRHARHLWRENRSLGPGFQATFGGARKGGGVCRSPVFEVVHEGSCLSLCSRCASGW